MEANAIAGDTAGSPAPIASLCELVVRLYDRAIGDLERAAEAAEHGDIVARFQATAAAAEILAQLQAALDHNIGGQIAENLDRLYAFILIQLPQVNLHNDARLARDLAALLGPLRQSWVELDRKFGIKDTDPANAVPGPVGPVTELVAAI